MEPACGTLSLEVLRVLGVLLVSAVLMPAHSCMTYPLLTPSTWRSTHHTPSQPSRDHSAQYLIACPTGSHSRTQKYRTERISSGGIRKTKTPAVQIDLKMLDGAGGTGKKGAIAVPKAHSQRSEARAKHVAHV
jgi:hypothetical protein